MTAQHFTNVAGVSGAIHTGPGQQFNLFPPTEPRRERPPRRLAEDELLELDRQFVAPPFLGRARATLSRHRVVLLFGPAGGGTRTAAKMLLHGLGEQHGRFHELSVERGTEDGITHDDVAEHDRLLLDLSGTTGGALTTAQQHLLPFLRTVSDRRALLAVVLPPQAGNLVAWELRPRLAEIEPPPAPQVFLRHLRTHGIPPPPEKELAAPALQDSLADAPMRDVAALADLVRRARDRDHRGEGGFPRWRDEALAAWNDRAAEVSDLMARRTSGPHRALLLTTAMLHDAHADAVHACTHTLLRLSEQPELQGPLLEHPGLAHQLAKISARPDNAGQVTFHALNFDREVRRHFWNNYPALRPAIRRWMVECIGVPALTVRDRDNLVRRFAEHALRTEPVDTVLQLAEQWAAPAEQDLLRRRAADQALKAALEHETHGVTARQKVYAWCIRADLPSGLASVLVPACAETIAVNHPRQAMVRLHHLTRQANAAADNARRALVELTTGENRLYRSLLQRIANGLRNIPRAPDDDLFLQLADPARLTDTSHHTQPVLADAEVRRQLAFCWGSVLSHRRCRNWPAYVARWLDACREHHYADPLLDVLAEAGARHPEDVPGRLYAAALDWADEAGGSTASDRSGRIALADRLWRRLDRLSGSSPSAYSL